MLRAQSWAGLRAEMSGGTRRLAWTRADQMAGYLECWMVD